MNDAVIAAADELGQVDPALWPEHVKGDPGQGMKGFFKTLALKELRTFGVIVARLIPTHVTTHKLPRYVSEEQLKAELREAGLPEDLVLFMRPVDASTIDPNDLGPDPYGDPENEDDDGNPIIDVTPEKST
jgi:hypothetical protein